MRQDSSRFWFEWTLATFVGYTVGLPFVTFISLSIPYGGNPPLLIGFIGGAELGAAIGLAQWLWLCRHLGVTWFWIVASIIGGALGMAPGMFISETVAASTVAAYRLPFGGMWQYLPMAVLFGLGLGSAQWWRLRQYSRCAGWWIVVNWIGWTVGMGSGPLMVELFTPVAGIISFFLVPGLLAGAITGIFIVHTLDR
jgi:hypothetical protein